MPKNKIIDLKAYAGVVQNATQGSNRDVPIDLIDIEAQVRTQFDPEQQEKINKSIAAQGIDQPVILLAKSDGRYQLIAGEYRVRGAKANGLAEVPSRIRHDLADWEIRRIQVSENLERTPISAFDEAVGVSQDVERYGFDIACKIWNRSEGWMSKRSAVLNYSEPVRRLLQDGMCNDLEVAHSLNQIAQVDEIEYGRLEKRLRDGIPLSRTEARGKVQQVKEWKQEAEQRRARISKIVSHPEKTAKQPKRQAVEVTNVNTSPQEEVGILTDRPAFARSAQNSTTTVLDGTAPARAKLADGPGSTTQSDVQDVKAEILQQMVTVYQYGAATPALIESIQDELRAIGADMNQTEWAMWSLYQTLAMPLLAALGETRAQRYLQKTIADLRKMKAQDIWNALHPATDSARSADWDAPRSPVAPMPEKWRF